MAKVESWEVSDEIWALVEPLLPQLNARAGRRRKSRRWPGGGRKAIAPRDVFAAIVYVLRTGCQWKALPKVFGSASTIHTHFRRWRQDAFFVRLWRAGLAECDEMSGIAWEWQSLEGTQGKAPLAQEAMGNNPTHRGGGKRGIKRSLLFDGRGTPLSLILAGANPDDVKLLGLTLDAIVIKRPRPTARRPQNLCVDKGYTGKPAEKEMRARGSIPHVPQKGSGKARRRKRGKARRCVVERTHSWMNNYRKLRVR